VWSLAFLCGLRRNPSGVFPVKLSMQLLYRKGKKLSSEEFFPPLPPPFPAAGPKVPVTWVIKSRYHRRCQGGEQATAGPAAGHRRMSEQAGPGREMFERCGSFADGSLRLAPSRTP
jgi:hypothetical protein